MPGELTTTPAPGTAPLPNADPNTWNPLPRALVDEAEFISEGAEPSIARPEVDIDAAEVVPDIKLVADVSAAVDDELAVVKEDTDEEDDVTETVDTSPCSALGIAVELSGVDKTELSGVDKTELSGVDKTELSGVEAADVSGDTVCAALPAAVLSAWVAAPANPLAADEEVVGSGAVNAVNVDAADDAPA